MQTPPYMAEKAQKRSFAPHIAPPYMGKTGVSCGRRLHMGVGPKLAEPKVLRLFVNVRTVNLGVDFPHPFCFESPNWGFEAERKRRPPHVPSTPNADPHIERSVLHPSGLMGNPARSTPRNNPCIYGVTFSVPLYVVVASEIVLLRNPINTTCCLLLPGVL